ncbi:MAG: hypothetical protein KAH23_07510 [Kiritimatiellae bacterium]|nr:hypothetical protein [Kiritimatiellia bacterium]
MPLHEIEDHKKKEPEPKPQQEQEDDDFEPKHKWWPLIPAIPVVLAIVLSLWPKSADIDPRKVKRDNCIKNLYTIISIKENYAKNNKLSNGEAVPPKLMKTLQNFATCPGDGIIRIREIGREPRCSRHGLVSEWEKQQKSMAVWHDITTATE